MQEDLIEQLRLAREEWADLHAAAQLKEELKTATLSQWMGELGDIAINRAEAEIKRSRRWSEYIREMVETRQAANRKRAFCEYLQMLIDRQRSAEATARAEARL